MAQRLVSSMTCGVGILPSWKLFRTCLVWPIVRMLKWQIFWSFLVTLISGMLAFSEWLKTRRWISLPCSSICYTLSD